MSWVVNAHQFYPQPKLETVRRGVALPVVAVVAAAMGFMPRGWRLQTVVRPLASAVVLGVVVRRVLPRLVKWRPPPAAFAPPVALVLDAVVPLVRPIPARLIVVRFAD